MDKYIEIIMLIQIIALIIMAIVLYALTRQVGILFGRIAPAGALTINNRLKVGDLAPIIDTKTLANTPIKIGGTHPQKRNTLLFFLSPTCAICKSLLPSILSAERHENNTTDVLYISDGDQNIHDPFVAQYGIAPNQYIISELVGMSYAIGRLPYGVLIDEQGIIASLGLLNTREHIDSLFEAKERKVSSLQMYLNDQK